MELLKNITTKDIYIYKPDIALVLTGHYRSFDLTNSYWELAVKDQNVTYYCNTWDTIDSITYSWHKGESIGIPLNENQKEKLYALDHGLHIQNQEFTEEEMNDKYTTAPVKSLVYQRLSLIDVLSRIPTDNKHDIVLISRYDIHVDPDLIRRLTHIEENTVIIGARKDSSYYKDLAAVGLIIALRTDEIYKLLFVLREYIEKVTLPIDQRPKFKADEELFTYLLYKYFKTVQHQWDYIRDFGIIR